MECFFWIDQARLEKKQVEVEIQPPEARNCWIVSHRRTSCFHRDALSRAKDNAPCCGKILLRHWAFSLVRWIYDDLRNTWKPLDTFVFPMFFSISGFSIQWFQYRHLSHILQFPSGFPWAGKSSRNVATNESEQPERFTVHGVT